MLGLGVGVLEERGLGFEGQFSWRIGGGRWEVGGRAVGDGSVLCGAWMVWAEKGGNLVVE